MRRAPIGTGPFKFVEYKPNQSIKVTRNPNYWKPGRPYLDGIEYTIIANRSTGDPVLRLRQVRHDFPVRDHRAVDQRREGTDADGAVRHVADERRGATC